MSRYYNGRQLEDMELKPFLDVIDRHIKEVAKACESYAIPQRIVAGIPMLDGESDWFKPVVRMPHDYDSSWLDRHIGSAFAVSGGVAKSAGTHLPAPLTLKNKQEALTKLIEAGMIRTTHGRNLSTTTRPKENIMTVDRKNFVLKATPVKAEALAHKHLGHLVTITLPSGAEVTDILVGVSVGGRYGTDAQFVIVGLQNIRSGFEYDPPDFQLDPKSVVQVRRLRPVPAAKKTARR